MPLKLSSLFGKLRPLLNFTANKYVLIKDWRLGVLLRGLQIAILVYVFVDIFNKASYLNSEVPTGSVTVWPDGLSTAEKVKEFASQREAVKQGNLDYCENPESYQFDWNGVHHGDFKCTHLDAASLFVHGESQAFVTTSMRVEKLHYFYPGTNNTECSEKDGMILAGSISDACVYTESQSYFPIRPEDITLNFIHSYRTSSIVDKKGALPRTIIKAPGFSDNSIEIKRGEGIKLKLRDLLDISGINLDKRLDEQDNSPCSDTSQGNYTNDDLLYPHARLSGLILQLSFNYYTRKLAPEPHTKETGDNSESVVCVLEVTPQNRWSLMGSEIRHMMNKRTDPVFLTTESVGTAKIDDSELLASQTDFQRNGVALVFTSSGSVGRFDFSALIDALVAGSVLLAIAQMVTTYVAIYALGLSSQLYKAFMMETVDWRQEYARYAAQAIVAGHVFMHYDGNSSMKLDRREIFDVLKKLMPENDEMEDWQLAALTDFLMRHGDRGAKTVKGRFDVNQKAVENFIDIKEWIDIFTEEKATWPLLQRLIEEEYPDEESRSMVENLLLRTTQKRDKLNASGAGNFDELSGEEGEGMTPVVRQGTEVGIDRGQISDLLFPRGSGEITESRGLAGRRSVSLPPRDQTVDFDVEQGANVPLLQRNEERTDEDGPNT